MPRWLIGVAVVSTAILVDGYQWGEAQAASFECAKASNIVETLICTNPNLSQMDEKLAAAYTAVRSKSADQQRILLEQRAWISQRNRCQTAACISGAYTKRLAELEGNLGVIGANAGGVPSQNQANIQRPRIGISQLPLPDQCQAFINRYLKGAITMSTRQAAEAAFFKNYFGIDLDSATENDLKAVLGWTKRCQNDDLYVATLDLQYEINNRSVKISVSNYIEDIRNIPVCDSENVIALFKSTISNSPNAITNGVQLLAVKSLTRIEIGTWSRC